jgi:sec-independent protein translocase protein TatC
MRKFFTALKNIFLAPFRFLKGAVSLTKRIYKKIDRFLNEEPEEQPFLDAFSNAIHSSEEFFEHVEALRKYLFAALITLSIAVILSFFFLRDILEFLARPVGGLEHLQAIEVTESIGVFMRIALFSGITISLPFVFFEMWLFFAPGLRVRARKQSLVGIPLATLLFIGGGAFAYYVMLPAALPFLLHFMDIQTNLRPHSYFTFITGVMFWIGVSFEFPLVIFVLTSMGFVKPHVLKEQWRFAIVLIAIIAAAITPTVDPVNMALVMLPMSLLYFVSILLSYVAYAGREEERNELTQRKES